MSTPAHENPNSASGDRLISEALLLREQWKEESLNAAAEKYRSAITLFKRAGDKKGEARTLLGLSEILIMLGQTHTAFDRLDRALRLATDSSEIRLQIDILNRRADIEIDLRNRSAQKRISRATDLIKETDYAIGKADTLFNAGRLYLISAKDSEKARNSLNEALDIYIREKNLVGQADTLLWLGLVEGDSGKVDKSRAFLDRALAAAIEANNPAKEARINLTIALFMEAKAQWQQSLDLYRKTLARVRESGDQRTLLIALNGNGDVCEAMGNMEEALQRFKESLNRSRKIGDEGNARHMLNHIAGVHANTGKYQEAINIYRKLVAFASASGDSRTETYTLTRLGTVYESIGSIEKAHRCYKRAVKSGSKAANHPRAQALARASLGALLYRTGNYKDARVQQEQALSLMQAAEDKASEDLVRCYLARLDQHDGDIDHAFTEAQELVKAIEERRSEIVDQEQRESYSASFYHAQELLVDLLMQKHSNEPDAGHAATALETCELARARSLAEMIEQAHANPRETIDAAVEEKESVLARSLQKKAGERESTRQKIFDLEHKLRSIEDTQELAESKRKLKSIGDEIPDLIVQLKEARDEVAKRASKKSSSLREAHRLTLPQIQETLLDADTYAIEYYIGDERSYAWVMGQGYFKSVELPQKSKIEKACADLYNELKSIPKTSSSGNVQRSTAGIKKLDAALKNLSRMLLQPLGDLGSKRLVIIPDGALQFISFAALNEPDSKQPLIAAHEIVTLPSLSVLAELREEQTTRAKATRTLAIFADPLVTEDDERITERPPRTSRKQERPRSRSGMSGIERSGLRFGAFDNSDQINLPRLGSSADEARDIADIFKDKDPSVWTGFDALRERAVGDQLSQFGIIHFATHGLLDFQNPRLSCLVLSRFNKQGKPLDGFLRLQDVYGMKLSADLVVLSACRTALGKSIRGEGLISLTRGFFFAGASRVVASLWDVEDEASSHLMKLFYTDMLGPGKPSAAAALREAQNKMRTKPEWQDPYFWAGFVLQGEWR